jgi:hypothetical protein
VILSSAFYPHDLWPTTCLSAVYRRNFIEIVRVEQSLSHVKATLYVFLTTQEVFTDERKGSRY